MYEKSLVKSSPGLESGSRQMTVDVGGRSNKSEIDCETKVC